MQRGVRLFNSLTLFEDEAPQEPQKPHRGRNPAAIEKRNELVMFRYYYYAKIHRLQYPDVLANLEKEFFVSQTIIQRIVTARGVDLVAMKRNPPTLKILKEKYKWFNWQGKCLNSA